MGVAGRVRGLPGPWMRSLQPEVEITRSLCHTPWALAASGCSWSNSAANRQECYERRKTPILAEELPAGDEYFSGEEFPSPSASYDEVRKWMGSSWSRPERPDTPKRTREGQAWAPHQGAQQRSAEPASTEEAVSEEELSPRFSPRRLEPGHLRRLPARVICWLSTKIINSVEVNSRCCIFLRVFMYKWSSTNAPRFLSFSGKRFDSVLDHGLANIF